MKLSGHPNAQEIPADITAEELRAEILSEIIRRLGVLPHGSAWRSFKIQAAKARDV